MAQQTFVADDETQWLDLAAFRGARLLPLAVPVPEGSIHRLLMKAGTVIPVHTHPADEYVYVLVGNIKTGQQVCVAGTFWNTPAHVEQGPHLAMTDVELLTVRLGAMGQFERN